MRICFLLLFSCAFLLPAGGREIRTFTNTSGKSIEGEILDLREGKVRLRVSGRVYDVAVETLSAEDREFLQDWDQARKGEDEKPDGEYSEVIFEDDFSGEGFKEGWGHYKSESVVEDGVLTGKTIDIKDHAGVDSIRFEGRRDMEVSVKFRFAGPTAYRFNVWFDDKNLKESHAGHVCSVAISPKDASIQDAKTGNMRLDIREKRQAGEELDEATKAMLAEKMVRFPLDLEDSKEEWHRMVIRTRGDVVTLWIDDEEIGSLRSEGLAHPTKSLVSLTTNEDDVQYDDFVVKAAPASSGGGGEAE